MEIWPGHAYPLGATFDGSGTNFALFSEVAERVELCLFDERPATRDPRRADRGRRLRLALLPAAGAARPALRLPRARAVGPGAAGCAATPTSCCSTPTPRRPPARSTGTSRCSATTSATRTRATTTTPRAHMTHGVVINPFFDWEGDRRLDIPYNETVIYEAHVKGLTQLHPDVPEELRGTYAGLAHPAVIEHLTKLGVTAIELMPVHQFVQDSTLLDKGLRNYWGYNTLGFFAPHADYAAADRPGRRGQQVQEFKSMVKSMHAAGIEVILDVVYNHTAEGNHLGPDAELQGHRQPGVLPARRGRPALLHGLHRHRELPQRAPPPLAAADHGLAALLGDRDARRRLPLRPRRRPWPASSTTWTGWRRSSSSCSRTRSSAR